MEFNSRCKPAEFHTEKNSGPYAGAVKSKKKATVKPPPAWAKRVRDRMKELDNMSVPALAARLGHGDAPAFIDKLYKIVQGKVYSPRGSLLADIAAALGWTEQELRFGVADVSSEDIAADYTSRQEARRDGGVAEWATRAGTGGGGEYHGVRRDGEYQDPVKSEVWRFPSRFLREELRATEATIAILETQGDSMEPTLRSGDRVIVDTSHKLPSPDGIYAIRDRFDFIVVKRLETVIGSQPAKIRVISDNKSHQVQEVDAQDFQDRIVGRVVWGLKRL